MSFKRGLTAFPYSQYEEISLVNLFLLLTGNISVILLMTRGLSDVHNVRLINFSSSCLACGGGQVCARLSDGGSIVRMLPLPGDSLPHRQHGQSYLALPHLSVPPVKPEVIFLQLAHPESLVAGLDQEADPALEHGVVASQLHLVQVTPSLQAAGRGGQPLPLAVSIQVDPSSRYSQYIFYISYNHIYHIYHIPPPAPLPEAVSPTEQCGPLPHRPGLACAGVSNHQGEVGLVEILKPVGEDDVNGKY